MKRLLDKLRDINHLFAKLMVLWCVACGTAASADVFEDRARGKEKAP